MQADATFGKRTVESKVCLKTVAECVGTGTQASSLICPLVIVLAVNKGRILFQVLGVAYALEQNSTVEVSFLFEMKYGRLDSFGANFIQDQVVKASDYKALDRSGTPV